jgi:cell fate (sporulation/competence/biofilm development) regulator YlbF (YheA/YmcA/DUF963 family)
MDLIQMARELGAAIQQDERYLALEEANAVNEADAELNNLIGEIQMIQMSYQNEAGKEDADEQKLQAYDKRFSEVYSIVMENPNMQKFQTARQEIDELMKYITGILTLCVRGEDPATCEPQQEHDCSGGCSSCGGGCE